MEIGTMVDSVLASQIDSAEQSDMTGKTAW